MDNQENIKKDDWGWHRKHKIWRIVIAAFVALFIFWIGMKVGEFRSVWGYGGFGRHGGYMMMHDWGGYGGGYGPYYDPYYRGYYANPYYNGGTPAMPPSGYAVPQSATSSPATTAPIPAAK